MIIRPFNAAHLLLLALAAGAVVLLWVLLRGQPERCRSAVLITVCGEYHRLFRLQGLFVPGHAVSGGVRTRPVQLVQ